MKQATNLIVAFILCALSVNAQTSLIDSLNDLSLEYARKDVVKQKGFLYKGISLCKQVNSPKLSGFYSMIVVSHQSLGDLDSAKHYLDLLSNLKGEDAVLSYNQAAGLFWKNQGKPKEALPFMKKSLELTKDSTNMAGMMLNIGNNYKELGRLKEAADYHLKSLALFEKVGNKKGQSFAYNSLGSDYVQMQKWKKAGVYYEKSLKIKEELKDKRGLITTLGGLGNVRMELGEYAAAISLFERELVLANEMQTPMDQGHAYHHLGQVYYKMKESEKSKANYIKALAAAKQVKDEAWISWIESNLQKLDEDKLSTKTREDGLLKTLHQYEEVGDRISIANSLENISDFYSEQKDYARAYSNLRRSKNINDSSRGLSVDEQLRSLEERYANEKRDREIALLMKDQELKTADLERKHAVQAGVIIALISLIIIGALLVNRYQVISRSRRHQEIEKVRNAIARDLHDDIGSTLSSINILSQLAIREGNDGAVKHFNKIAEQSGRMMESMSDIVWSISPGNDSLEQVVSKMKEFAAEILEPKNITYRFNGEESLKNTTLSLDKRKNLFLIFKEAVNNAAKYSGATDLEITFTRQGNTLSLSVSDNGGGFEPETVKAGNGLKNMKERARALSARFHFKTQLSEGTSIALELPLT